MGSYINIEFSPVMSAQEWELVWDETLQLLAGFPIPLVRSRQIDSEFGKRTVLSQELREVTDDGLEFWLVWGDRISRGLSETFVVYRSLDYYRDGKEWPDVDPLYCQVFPDPQWAPYSGCELSHCKTQGEPYHYAILAAGMLLESRFPKHVLLHGDINLDSEKRVKLWMDRVCTTTVDLPVCVDPARLWNRIEGALPDSDLVVKRFQQVYAGPKKRAAQWLLMESRDSSIRMFAEHLARYTAVTQYGAIDIIQAVLEGSQRIEAVLELIRLSNMVPALEDDPRTLPRFALCDLLDLLCRYFVTLPEWSSAELTAFSKYMESDGSDLEMMNRLFFSMSGAPMEFDFTMDSGDLLDAFSSVEPENRDSFAAIIADNDAKNRERIRALSEGLESVVSRMPQCEVDEPASDSFDDWIVSLAKINAPRFKDPDLAVQAIGKSRGEFVSHAEAQGIFRDETVAGLLTTLTKVSEEASLNLFEECWQDIDRISSVELLKRMIILAIGTSREIESRAWTRLIMQTPSYWPSFDQA